MTTTGLVHKITDSPERPAACPNDVQTIGQALQIVEQPVPGKNLIRIAASKQLVQKFLLDSHVMILSFSSS